MPLHSCLCSATSTRIDYEHVYFYTHETSWYPASYVEENVTDTGRARTARWIQDSTDHPNVLSFCV